MAKHSEHHVHTMHHKVKAEHHRRMAKEHERMAVHHDKMEEHFAAKAHEADEEAGEPASVHAGRSTY